MFNGFSNITSPTLNGLVDIDADTVNSSSVSTTLLNVNGVDVGAQIATNTTNIATNTNNITNLQQVTSGVTYNSGSDTTTIDNNVAITKTLNVTQTVTAPTFDGTATQVNLSNTASGTVNYMVFSATNTGSSSLLTDTGGDAFYNNTTNTASINISGKSESINVADYNTSGALYPAFVVDTGDQEIYIDKTTTSLTYNPGVGQLTTEKLNVRQTPVQMSNMYMGTLNTNSMYISTTTPSMASGGGDFNVGIGWESQLGVIGGSNNFSLGVRSLTANKNGGNNCMMGHRAGYVLGFVSLGGNNANFNTGVGDSSMTNALYAVEATCVGALSGGSLLNNSYRCTCIGVASNCADGLSYATAIGAGAYVDTDNTVVLGLNTGNVKCPNTLSVASNVTASTAPTLGSHLCNKTYVDGLTGSSLTTNTVQNITANKTFYGAQLLVDDGSGDNTSISQLNQITNFKNNNLVNTTITITGIIPATSLNRIVPTDGSNPTTANILNATITGINIPNQTNTYFVSAHTFNSVEQITTLGLPSGQIGSLGVLTIGMFITSGLGTNFSNGTYVTGLISPGTYSINQPALNTSLFKVNVNFSLITTNISLSSSVASGTIIFKNDGAFQFLINNASGNQIMPLSINSTAIAVNVPITAPLTVSGTATITGTANLNGTTNLGGNGLIMNNSCMYGRDDQFNFTSIPAGAPNQPIGFTTTYSETAVTFTSGTVFNYGIVLPALDNGVWLVNGTLTLNQGSGSYSGSPYLYIRLVTATGMDFYPTTGNGNRVILPTSTATPVIAPFVSTVIVKSSTQVRCAIQGQIVMSVGTATKALNVAFTKIA